MTKNQKHSKPFPFLSVFYGCEVYCSESFNEPAKEPVFMEDNGGVTMQQCVEKFSLTPDEISSDLSVLRHIELGKGQKREDGVYFVIWEA